MFTRFARLPLKRCLHTASGTARSTPRFTRTPKVILGTSAAATVYLSWKLSSERNTVHSDSPSAKPSALTPTPRKLVTPSPEQPSASPETSPESESESPTLEAPEQASETEVGEGGEDQAAPQTQGAYNPETGEINWDCPCLGGMAQGPCGEQFKEAFSCFVFSEDEPKGINCVDAFKKMQDCFREHPEIYADEIMKDDDDDEGPSPSVDGEVADTAKDSEFVEDAPAPVPPELQSEGRTAAPSSTSPQ